ncbi:MAG TPA: hypothetical protein VNO33_19725 [Kofleriaceae bacterium]|nr:hypothetical protein [Kofleriaceae bacterium]
MNYTFEVLDLDQLGAVVGGQAAPTKRPPDTRTGMELAYDRAKACAVGAVAGQAIPIPAPPYVKAAMGCTAGVAEQVRQEGGFGRDQTRR